MTITITKGMLAVAILAIALLIPATAFATHTFSDVADGEFYTDAVEWAFDNGITTGTTDTTFSPNDAVTRAQSVTFAKRYDDNIVQPALATTAADIATNTSTIAGLDTAQPFAATAFETSIGALTVTPTPYVTVTVTAPVAGHVTVNSTAYVGHTVGGGIVECVIVESTDIPPFDITGFDESAQRHQTTGSSFEGSVSGTRMFAIAAGTTIDYVLACEESSAGGIIAARNLTAIFTPAP